MAVACNGDRNTDREAAAGAPDSSGDTEAINPADFSATITHPLFPLASARNTEFAGREQKSDGGTSEVRVVSRLLDKTDTIAGVAVAVVEVMEHKDGQLLELTEDYFAQHQDGTVWYFGERVTDYKDGKPVGHGASGWPERTTTVPGSSCRPTRRWVRSSLRSRCRVWRTNAPRSWRWASR